MIDTQGVMLDAACSRLSLEYELIVHQVPNNADNTTGDTDMSVLLHVPGLLVADFDERGHLLRVDEQYDVIYTVQPVEKQ